MATPTSLPVIPPQPDLLAYGIQELGLFNTYTRDSYLLTFGVQAPAWGGGPQGDQCQRARHRPRCRRAARVHDGSRPERDGAFVHDPACLRPLGPYPVDHPAVRNR